MIRQVLTTAFAFALFALGMAGCAVAPPAPVPERLEPETAYNGEDAVVRIIGSRFYPSLAVQAAATDGGSDVDEGFEVRLRPASDPDADGVALDGVVFEGQTSLRGVVPAGLAPGAYDVVVTSPSGTSGSRRDVFVVKGTQVDRVSLAVDSVVHEVYEAALTDITLQDPDGAVLEEDLEIVATLVDSSGDPVDGQLSAEGLLDATFAEDRREVRGRLGDDGTARLLTIVGTPGDVVLRVRSADPADGIQDDDLVLSFTRGSELAIRVELPESPFTVTAGESFTATLSVVDQFGNLVEDTPVFVALTDACRSLVTGVQVLGVTDVDVTVTTATGGACEANALVATGAVVQGRSVDFEVLAGPHAAYDVVAVPTRITAGAVVTTFVSAIDAYGNPTTSAGTITEASDTVGGVSGLSCIGGAEPYCNVSLTKATQSTRIQLRDEQGRSGQSNAVTVDPGAPTRLALGVPLGTWTAGTAREVPLTVVDAYGNAVPAATWVAGSLAASADPGTASCSVAGLTASCTLFTATSVGSLTLSGQVRVNTSVNNVTGTLEGIAVENGPLDHATLQTALGQVVAGQPVVVQIATFDAWDNAYAIRTVNRITLTDDQGRMTPISVVLGGAGTGSGSVLPTVAGTWRFRALDVDRVLGTSNAVIISAGPPAILGVELEEPWAWVGEPVDVRIEARDPWGNRSTYAGNIAVVSQTGGGVDKTFAMVNGVASGRFTWDAWRSRDVLEADAVDRPLEGSSAALIVASRCETGSPTAALRFDGLPFARACADSEGMVDLVADLAGSTAAGGRTLLAYGVEVDGQGQTDTNDLLTIPEIEVGVHAVRGLVLQSNGCGDETSTGAWVGWDDGTPVGPLEVVAGTSVLDPDAADPSTAVLVSAVQDCQGRVTTGEPLRIRTDRGVVVGAVTTGVGLEILTDGNGTAAARVDVGTSETGGPATVTVWADNEVASGTVSIDVLGDDVAPVVWSQAPEGAVSTPVDAIVITFSEPVRLGSFPGDLIDATADVAVADPTLDLSSDGRTLTLSYDPPIPSDAAYRFELRPGVTDLAGNPLAGRWDGRPGPYAGAVAVDGDVDPVDTCAVDTATFRPDGDDGDFADADEVSVTYAAARAPAWWAIDIVDSKGATVRAFQLPPTAATDGWTWDGRGDDGAVVGAGVYALRVDAEGFDGNRGGACTVPVTVDLHEGMP